MEKYNVSRVLGEGAFGMVMLAYPSNEPKADSKRLAIKVGPNVPAVHERPSPNRADRPGRHSPARALPQLTRPTQRV